MPRSADTSRKFIISASPVISQAMIFSWRQLLAQRPTAKHRISPLVAMAHLPKRGSQPSAAPPVLQAPRSMVDGASALAPEAVPAIRKKAPGRAGASSSNKGGILEGSESLDASIVPQGTDQARRGSRSVPQVA